MGEESRFDLIRQRAEKLKMEEMTMGVPRLDDTDKTVVEDVIKSRIESGEHTDKSTAEYINKKNLLQGRKISTSFVYTIRKGLGFSGRSKKKTQEDAPGNKKRSGCVAAGFRRRSKKTREHIEHLPATPARKTGSDDLITLGEVEEALKS